MAVENLANKVDSEEFSATASKLNQEFVDIGAPKEVNISGEVKVELQSAYKDLVEKKIEEPVYMVILQKVIPILNNEMKVDNFPRFIRSDAFQKIASTLFGNPKVMISRIVQNFPYSLEDFQIPCITTKDVAFSKYLLEDYFDWNLSFSKNGCNGYYSEMDHFKDVPYLKGIGAVKLQTILPYSFDVCCLANSSYDYYAIVNKNIEGVILERFYTLDEILEFQHDNKHVDVVKSPHARHTTYTNLFYPMQMRRVRQISTIFKHDDQRVSILLKPFLEKDSTEPAFGEKGIFEYEIEGKKSKKVMYQAPCFSQCTLTKIDENKTLQTDLLFINTSGWLSGKLMQNISQRMASELMSKDVNRKYEILTKEKIPKDAKLNDFKKSLRETAQGKLMYTALFGDSELTSEKKE